MRNIYVDFVRDGVRGNGAARMGNSRWRRLTELRAGGAKSVFHFDVQGSVAKSTHAGIPWLRFIRQRLGRASISGRSTGGKFQLGARQSSKSIPLFGATGLLAQIGPATSTMPIALQRGFRVPTETAAWQRLCSPISRPPSERRRRWKVGYWEFLA